MTDAITQALEYVNKLENWVRNALICEIRDRIREQSTASDILRAGEEGSR